MNDSTPKWAMNESAPLSHETLQALSERYLPKGNRSYDHDVVDLVQHVRKMTAENAALAKRVEELEEANRILRAALARQEDICARTHWSGEAR